MEVPKPLTDGIEASNKVLADLSVQTAQRLAAEQAQAAQEEADRLQQFAHLPSPPPELTAEQAYWVARGNESPVRSPSRILRRGRKIVSNAIDANVGDRIEHREEGIRQGGMKVVKLADKPPVNYTDPDNLLRPTHRRNIRRTRKMERHTMKVATAQNMIRSIESTSPSSDSAGPKTGEEVKLARRNAKVVSRLESKSAKHSRKFNKIAAGKRLWQRAPKHR